jgi:hypothetical protein
MSSAPELKKSVFLSILANFRYFILVTLRVQADPRQTNASVTSSE